MKFIEVKIEGESTSFINLDHVVHVDFTGKASKAFPNCQLITLEFVSRRKLTINTDMPDAKNLKDILKDGMR